MDGLTRPLRGRRVLVTGASSGIGRAIAEGAARAGARVAGVARRGHLLYAHAESFGLLPVVADLSRAGEPGRAVGEAIDRMGGLDVLVNNAGRYLVGGLSEGVVADWREMFEVNVIAVLAATQAALPALRSAAGDVVNVSSLSAHRLARTSTAVYAATKHAVWAATEGMRQELAGDGIRVLMVSPGLVATELGAGTRDPDSLEAVRDAQQNVGLAPEVVATAVLQALELPAQATVRDLLIAPTQQLR